MGPSVYNVEAGQGFLLLLSHIATRVRRPRSPLRSRCQLFLLPWLHGFCLFQCVEVFLWVVSSTCLTLMIVGNSASVEVRVVLHACSSERGAMRIP